MWIGKCFLTLTVLMVSAVEVSAQPPGRGGRPSYDRLLGAFDANDDDALEEDEVPAAVWSRLSQADASDDGVVTRNEFDSYRPGAR